MAALLAVGIVVGARVVLHNSSHIHRRGENGRNSETAAMQEGHSFAAAVNLRSKQIHKAFRLTPVHCAHDPGTWVCSFRQSHPRGCRFVRWRTTDAGLQIQLAGLVPMSFCRAGNGVA